MGLFERFRKKQQEDLGFPVKQWLSQWEVLKERTRSPVDLNAYFAEPEIAGKVLAVMDIGPCSVPSGRLLVRDPLVSLGRREERPYFLTAPAGSYRTEICVVEPSGGDCARYAAVRLRFTDRPAAAFYEALTGCEKLDTLGEGDYFGFPVDAGLGCICDKAAHEAFCDFCSQWEREHPDGNLYDDYFAALFAENYEKHPKFQRPGGDWLNWTIPGTPYQMPMFQSGFGDGIYPAYWGIDEMGAVCQIVVHFIDIQLAYGGQE